MISGDNHDVIESSGLSSSGHGPGVARGRSTAREETTSILIPHTGLEASQLRSWNEAFAPYENQAGNEEVCLRARHFVAQRVLDYQRRTSDLRERWDSLNYLLEGNSMADSDMEDLAHVAEIYKAIETITPRIMKALFSDDPWFQVEGRKQRLARIRSEKLRAFLAQQLDAIKWLQNAPMTVRAMLIYGFSGYKTWWSTEKEVVVERHYSEEITDEGILATIRKQEKEEITFNGPKARIIDPIYFGIDLSCTDVADADWIYDQQEMSFDQLLELQDTGVFKNVEQLQADEPFRSDFSGHRADTRYSAVDRDQTVGLRRSPEGGSQMHRITEMWCRFAPRSGERTRKYVITVADERVVLRVMENPNDRKHMPYALCRASKYPFAFHGLAPMDQAMPLQVELDNFRQMAFETSKQMISPPIAVDPTIEMPESMWRWGPGKILPVAPDKLKEIGIKGNLAAFAGMHERITTDIEEITGAVRILQATSAGDQTATGVERRIEQAVERITDYVRAFSECGVQVLEQFHMLNKQYMTRREAIKVAGPGARWLTDYSEIGPEDFGPDVDFKIVGLGHIHTFGMEATRLKEFAAMSMPLIEQYPNAVNVPALLQMIWVKTVGLQGEQDVIKLPQDPMLAMDQEAEVELMIQGNPWPVHAQDDDIEHLQFLEGYMETAFYQRLPVEVQRLFEDHEFAHRSQLRYKKISNAPQEMTPRGTGMQQAEPAAADPNVMQQQLGSPGMTNGPGTTQQVATPGRAQPFTQTQEAQRAGAPGAPE